MKERVYGWYPSANDIYTRGPYTKYQQECLYKFRDTMYESKPVVPPSPSLMIRGYSPAPPPSRPTTAMDIRPGKTTVDRRPKTAPVPKFKLIPRLHIPTPQQCWATKLPETEYTTQNALDGSRPSTASTQMTWPMPRNMKPEATQTTQVVPNHMHHSDRSQINWPRPKAKPETPTPSHDSQEGFKRERIKSASIHREKTPVPSRPIKSAGPIRTPFRAATPAPDQPIPVEQQPQVEQKTDTPVYRPQRPVQVCEDEEEGDEWEIAREKHGWMAEVHGNPYGYKKIPKRPTYYVKCPEPELPPEPPAIHMENLETFFYNTIPNRPMTFSVHKEWISEVLHAKRLELQKRVGVKYRWKNFGFVY